MALVVEDGTGLSNAESFVSVAEADSYHTSYGNNASWASATTATKETALRMATQWIVLSYSRRWLGRRRTRDQSLPWPRHGVYDEDDYYVSESSVPSKIRNATAEMAARWIEDSTQFLPDSDVSRNIKMESVTVDVIRETIEYAGVKPTMKSFPKIDLQLCQYVEQGGRIYLS